MSLSWHHYKWMTFRYLSAPPLSWVIIYMCIYIYRQYLCIVYIYIYIHHIYILYMYIIYTHVCVYSISPQMVHVLKVAAACCPARAGASGAGMACPCRHVRMCIYACHTLALQYPQKKNHVRVDSKHPKYCICMCVHVYIYIYVCVVTSEIQNIMKHPLQTRKR